MKAAVLTGLDTIALQERPRPEVQGGHALVKVEYCGICGSDVSGYAGGHIVQPGTIMGHECSGTVAEVGNDVSGVQVGDRVWVRPAARCKNCYWCRRGDFDRCSNAFATAIGLGPDSDGAFAEYILVKYPDQMLFKLPPEVSFEEAALIEPLIVSRHAIRASRFSLGASALVVGAGPIGLGIIQFLKIGGAGKIVALEVSSARARLAAKLGADAVLNPLSEGNNLNRTILGLTDGVGPDIVFECSGAASALRSAVYYVVSGGQIVVVGLHAKEVPFDFWTLLHRKVDMRGSLGCGDDDIRDVIDALRRKRIETDSFISDTIALSDIDEKGFKRLLSSDDMVKILVRP